jgi:hypothetical protein
MDSQHLILQNFIGVGEYYLLSSMIDRIILTIPEKWGNRASQGESKNKRNFKWEFSK